MIVVVEDMGRRERKVYPNAVCVRETEHEDGKPVVHVVLDDDTERVLHLYRQRVEVLG